jgi:hypothetical protein
MAELSVQIGANITELLKKLKLTEKELKDLEKLSKKSASGFGKAFAGAPKATDQYKKATVNALPATQEFSRVIQDAPFGIQGVGNNIQQLTANFGHLSKQAGGSTKALKAMLSSLAGPAGMLLAVSAVTSLLTVYSDEISEAFGSTNKLSKATAEFAGEAQSEIIALKQLVEIATDENNSKKVRQGAIDGINKNYSKYLGNLDLESIKTDQVKTSIDKLTSSLITQAKIKGIASIIEEESKSNAEAELAMFGT